MLSTDGSTLGIQSHRIHLDGLTVSEVHHPRAFRAPAHFHQFGTLKLVLKGPYAERALGRSAIHPPLTVLTKPAGLVHTNDPFLDETNSILLELLSPNGIGATSGGLDLFRSPRQTPAGVAAAAGMRIALELRRPRDSTTALGVEEAVVELLTILSETPLREDTRPDWVGRVIERIEDEPRGRINLCLLAAEVGRERHYVSRGFRKATGMTISAFARRVRLARAVQALVETDTPIAVVAYQAGFTDQAHLTRSFRRSMGVTPGQHRRLARKLRLPLRRGREQR